MLIGELKAEAFVDPIARWLSAGSQVILMLVLIIGIMLDNDRLPKQTSDALVVGYP